MSSENVFLCQICFENYDIEIIKPKVLFCGHSLCEQCWEQILNEQSEESFAIACPICRQMYTINQSSNFRGSYNQTIIELLKEIENKKSKALNCSMCRESTDFSRSYNCSTCSIKSRHYEGEQWLRNPEIITPQIFLEHFARNKVMCANCALHQHIRQDHIVQDWPSTVEKFWSRRRCEEGLEAPSKQSIFTRIVDFFKK